MDHLGLVQSVGNTLNQQMSASGRKQPSALPAITIPNRSIRFIAQNLGGYSELVFTRCAQSLCDLADALYPQLPRTESGNTDVTGHDGIYVVAPNLVQSSCGMTAGRPAMAILRSISVRPRGGRIRAC